MRKLANLAFVALVLTFQACSGEPTRERPASEAKPQQIAVAYVAICPWCSGEGVVVCNSCNGKEQAPCRICKGEDQTKKTCPSCGGADLTKLPCRTCKGVDQSKLPCTLCKGKWKAMRVPFIGFLLLGILWVPDVLRLAERKPSIYMDAVIHLKGGGPESGYWVGDVTELYRLGIISREVAEADTAPLTTTFAPCFRAQLCVPERIGIQKRHPSRGRKRIRKPRPIASILLKRVVPTCPFTSLVRSEFSVSRARATSRS